jgi:hypothetical protein
MTLQRCAAAAALALSGALVTAPVRADFAVLITPPRFELAAKPGERLRQVIELTNADRAPAAMQVRTADWTLRPDMTVDFSDELAAGSCRPWVAIERRDLVLAPGQPYRFRFEVTPPPDTRPTECRFAVLFEGKDPTMAGPQQSIPLAGRIGVIVYVAVGDVAADLAVTSHGVEMRQGQPTPVLEVSNTGTAHGRLDGFLRGIDAKGESFEVTVATSPILAGETRSVVLAVTRPGDPETTVTPAWPLQVSGTLELGNRRSVELNRRFTP